MGISALIGLKGTVLLLVFCFFRQPGVSVIHIILLHASIVSFLVAIASLPAVNVPLLLGKSSDGSFPLWSMIIFGPYLFFVRLFVPLRRWKSGEPLFTEISEGLYVGGWPSSLDHLPKGKCAVIDCTCELPRSSALASNAYLSVATWDTRAPQPSQIESAVHWASRKRAQNVPLFIHCAFGHGRSVCVMCAILVAFGLAEDWKAAEKKIRERRPHISMNNLHRKSLEEWSKHRLSRKRDGASLVSSAIHGSS